jgi:hypothetical protein
LLERHPDGSGSERARRALARLERMDRIREAPLESATGR